MSETTVEYDLTEAHVLRLLEHHHRVSPMSRMYRKLTIALAGAAVGIASYVADQGWYSILWAGCGALGVATLYRWAGPSFNRIVWRRGLREGKGGIFGKRTLSLRADGIRCAGSQFESTLSWSVIDRVEADAHCLYLMMTGGGIPVPRAAFASAHESEAFFAKAKELHRSGSEQDA